MSEEITLRFEDAKDKSGKVKRVMWVLYKSKRNGYESIAAVNEIDSTGFLAREVDKIGREMIELRSEELKANKKKK